MSKQNVPPFDPQEFSKWLVEGLKETLKYRLKQTLNKEKILELIQSKIPTRNQLLHHALKQSLIKLDFKFEPLKLGDAQFQLIRKKYHEVPAGHTVRRLVLIPGFGDTPSSWIPTFGFARRDLIKNFDELLILDFPGYSGFLSHHKMTPSMTVLLSVVKMVCESNPPTALIGHSLGGWLAAKVAQQLTRPIDQLVVIAPSGLTPESERQAFADFILNNQNVELDELIEKIVHEPKQYHYLMKEEFSRFYAQPEVREFIESVSQDQFVDPSHPFACKKLSVIWGERDSFVPANWIRHWVENYGAYTNAYVMKETAHLPQLESPKVLADVVMNALLDRPAPEGTGWKRVNTRVRDYQPSKNTASDAGNTKLIS